MRIILILLFCTCSVYAQRKATLPVQPKQQSIAGWYTVVESNSKIWSKGGNIRIVSTEYNDVIEMTGFSNQGATVMGTRQLNRIIIPAQVVTVRPYGGGGKAEWTLSVSASGTIVKGKMRLSFYFRQGRLTEYTGEIVAVRMKEEN